MSIIEDGTSAQECNTIDLSAHLDALRTLARLRKEAAAEIDRLINFLDETTDTDEDTQVDDGPIDDDERGPSLDATHVVNQTRCSVGGVDDLEHEHDGREPDVDDEDGGDEEPSLGSAEPLEPEPAGGMFWFGVWHPCTEEDRAAVYDQTTWASGGGPDLEHDDCDHECSEEELTS